MITNIGNSHLDTLKNIDGVLKVKSEIIKNIKKGGYLIVPNENKKHLEIGRKLGMILKLKLLECQKSADFYATKINSKENGLNFVNCIKINK